MFKTSELTKEELINNKYYRMNKKVIKMRKVINNILGWTILGTIMIGLGMMMVASV